MPTPLPEKYVEARVRWLTKVAQQLLHEQVRLNTDGAKSMRLAALSALAEEDQQLTTREKSYDAAGTALEQFLKGKL